MQSQGFWFLLVSVLATILPRAGTFVDPSLRAVGRFCARVPLHSAVDVVSESSTTPSKNPRIVHTLAAETGDSI